MPTALSRRSGTVYGETSPKTHLDRINCYGNTLYIWSLYKRGLCGSLDKATASNAIFYGFEPRRGLRFF